MFRLAMSLGGVLAARAAGVRLGAQEVAKHSGTAARLAAADCALLRAEERLEPIPAPLPPRRRPRMLVGRYALGMAGGAAGAYLIGFVVLFLVAGMVERPVREQVIIAAIFGVLPGLVGFLVPGLLLGAWLSFGEGQRRVVEHAREVLRVYWETREGARLELAFGAISPQEAWARLAPFQQSTHPRPVPRALPPGHRPPLTYDPRG